MDMELMKYEASHELTAIVNRLAQARQRSGLSQFQVAKLLGLESPSTISHYENQEREVSVERLLQLAKIYDVSLIWLMTGRNPEFDEKQFQRLINQSIQVEEEAAELSNLFYSMTRQPD